ncbi:MAG: hypothetical protein WCF57_02505 [Pyrinomonadaceae bacterium]
MSSKERTHSKDKVGVKQPLAKPANGIEILPGQQIHPATLIRRANLDYGALSPRDALRLQRVIGNRAVGQLLTRTTERPPVQRMNGGKEDPKGVEFEQKMGVPPVKAQEQEPGIPYTKTGTIEWRLLEGKTDIEFKLADGIIFSTGNEKEFTHVLDILWKAGRDEELKALAGILLRAKKDVKLGEMTIPGMVNNVLNVLKRDRDTYVERNSIDEFLNHVAKTFSGNPELLTEKFLLGKPEWQAATANGNAIRKRIIKTAKEARALLTKPQLDLWEQNAGDFDPEQDMGLVDERIDAYVKTVRAYVADQKARPVAAAQQIATLYELAGRVLLPELWACGLFPPLNIIGFGEDCLFSRDKWVMSIGHEPVPMAVADELSTSILHETRHVEQAWAISTLWAKKKQPPKGIEPKMVTAINTRCKYPVKKGKQVMYMAERGELFHVNWDEIGKLQHALGATMADDAAIEKIDWKALNDFFLHIYWYFNHPREYDAYSSEQVYAVAYKRAAREK